MAADKHLSECSSGPCLLSWDAYIGTTTPHSFSVVYDVYKLDIVHRS